MAEVARGAALLVPPGDVHRAGRRARGRPSRRARGRRARALGLTVAGEHTWEASVARHLHAYAVAAAARQ